MGSEEKGGLKTEGRRMGCVKKRSRAGERGRKERYLKRKGTS